MRGNECLWRQRSTQAKGSAIVWIAEAEATQGLTESTAGEEEECVRRFVFSKGSDYVIYSQRLGQLQESDPLHRSLLTSCGVRSHSAS